ncbi:MAG: hypothetical protein V1789_00030 [PVC group bacterium]
MQEKRALREGKRMTAPEKIRSRPPLATVGLILLCFLYLTFAWDHFWNTNEYSRIFLTRALIDHQSLSIDKIIVGHDTQDKSYFRGRFYSNKAPISSFLAAPGYLAVRLTEIYSGISIGEEMTLYLIRSLTISIPSALFLLLLFKFWSSITLHYSIRRAVLIAYSLGTMVWPYSSMYYGHILAAMSLCLAFLIIFSAKETAAGSRALFECGFFCGLAFAIEYPTALISICLFMYAAAVGKKLRAAVYLLLGAVLIGVLWSLFDPIQAAIGPHVKSLIDPHQAVMIVSVIVTAVIGLAAISRAPSLLFFFAGAAPLVGATFYYHWKCFGGPLQFPYYHESYRQFAVAHREGIAGVSFPAGGRELSERLTVLLKLLISPYRGLFFYSPFLLLGVSGMIKMVRDAEWKLEGRLFLAIAVVYLLFLCSFTDWEGGWSMGPRHLVPLLPFLATAVVYQLGTVDRKLRRVLVCLMAVLGLISIAFIFIGTASFPYLPKEFNNPLYDLSWQLLAGGKIAPTLGELCGLKGGVGLVPLVVLVGILTAIFLSDLSRFAWRGAAIRIIFMLLSAATAAAVLLAWGAGSRLRVGRLSPYQRALEGTQKERVIAFMERTKGEGQ